MSHGTSQGGRRGYGPARAGLAIVADMAPGPVTGRAYGSALGPVTGRASAVEAAPGPCRTGRAKAATGQQDRD